MLAAALEWLRAREAIVWDCKSLSRAPDVASSGAAAKAAAQVIPSSIQLAFGLLCASKPPMALLRRLSSVLGPVRRVSGLAPASAALVSSGILDAPRLLHPNAPSIPRLALPCQVPLAASFAAAVTAPESMIWPKLGGGDSGSEESVRLALLGLCRTPGVLKASLQTVSEILERHRADGPAVYSMVIQCKEQRADMDGGKEGEHALLVVAPKNTGKRTSSFKGESGWWLVPSFYKIDADGRVHNEQWANGTALEEAGGRKKSKKYQASCRIIGGSHDGLTVEKWRINTFGNGMRVLRMHGKRNARHAPRGGGIKRSGSRPSVAAGTSAASQSSAQAPELPVLTVAVTVTATKGLLVLMSPNSMQG